MDIIFNYFLSPLLKEKINFLLKSQQKNEERTSTWKARVKIKNGQKTAADVVFLIKNRSLDNQRVRCAVETKSTNHILNKSDYETQEGGNS
jgi:hypothetical protein